MASGLSSSALPAGLHLGAVRLEVADLARSVEWYRRVLGLESLGAADGEARLGVTGAPSPLVVLQERTGAAPVPPQGRLGLYHFAILLPDRASLGRFLVHAAGLGIRIGAGDHLVSEALYLHDPDGLGIEVYADRPQATWRHEAGQLVMATDPLDLSELARAGGDEPWRGAPAGTVLGHVHLAVSDLESAAAFYQHGLGLEPTVWNYPGALFLAAGGYHHHLGLNTWARAARPAGEGDARLLEWEVVLPRTADVDAVVARLAAAGYAAERTTAAAARVRDPWGTAVLLRSDAA